MYFRYGCLSLYVFVYLCADVTSVCMYSCAWIYVYIVVTAYGSK